MTVSSYNQQTSQFHVYVNKPHLVESVSVAVWNNTHGGQDDLQWHVASFDSANNRYSVIVDVTTHSGPTDGNWVCHAYGTDLAGNLHLLGPAQVNI